MFLAISLLLLSFITAISVTSSAINNITGSINPNQVGLVNSDDNESEDEVSATNDDTETAKERIKEALEARNKDKFFCGKSTFGECQSDSDCITAGCSNSVCQSQNEEQTITTCEWRNCYNSTGKNINCICIKNKCLWSKLTENQIKKIIRMENRIKANPKAWECPLGCTCAGGTIRCLLENGRELTIYAGNSGNVIVQVKGENMTTNVTLYKSDKKLYAVLKNNETREIKALPDQVKERIRERLERQLENENISLDDNGTYQYQADKKARLFAFIPVTVIVKAEIDPQTGEIIKISKNPWWFFLARDESQQIVGASCGTVSPGSNDACCQNKGFDVWNSGSQQCEFSQ